MPSDKSSRTIVGLMGAAIVFSLVSNEVRISRGHAPSKHLPNGLTEAGTIVLGGGIATVLLVLIEKLGDPGHALATGLAGLTLAGAALIYGAPVWSAISGVTGSTKPTHNTPVTKGTHP